MSWTGKRKAEIQTLPTHWGRNQLYLSLKVGAQWHMHSTSCIFAIHYKDCYLTPTVLPVGFLKRKGSLTYLTSKNHHVSDEDHLVSLDSKKNVSILLSTLDIQLWMVWNGPSGVYWVTKVCQWDTQGFMVSSMCSIVAVDFKVKELTHCFILTCDLFLRQFQ